MGKQARNPRQVSFAQMQLDRRVRREDALSKISALIDWEALRPLTEGLYKRDVAVRNEEGELNRGGQTPFDGLVMLKAVLLGQWHSLSDPKLEQALWVRIDFLRFCGLSLDDEIPDETTLCRFRNRLVEKDRMEPLLRAVNAQLQAHGLMVQNASAAVIDATLITSAARPRKEHVLEVVSEQDPDAAEPVNMANATSNATQTQATLETAPVESVACSSNALEVQSTLTTSADPDASWLTKGKKSTYGYRGYVVVDGDEGYVRGVHTAPANESEFNHFAPTLDKADFEAQRVFADKGFSSKNNKAYVQGKGMKSALMHRAKKNKPLSQRQHNANRAMSKTRWIVEQGFGTLKRLFRMDRASYFTTAKVNAQLTAKAVCLNLLKAANKLCLIPDQTGQVRPQSA